MPRRPAARIFAFPSGFPWCGIGGERTPTRLPTILVSYHSGIEVGMSVFGVKRTFFSCRIQRMFLQNRHWRISNLEFSKAFSSVWMRVNPPPHFLQNASSSWVPRTCPDWQFTKCARKQTVHLIGRYRQPVGSSPSSLHAWTSKPVFGQRYRKAAIQYLKRNQVCANMI